MQALINTGMAILSVTEGEKRGKVGSLFQGLEVGGLSSTSEEMQKREGF